MGGAGETKRQFADALRELMREEPFARISVSDIAEKAGISRKSFYNHFKDKYELVNWICYTQFVQTKEAFLEGNAWSAFSSFLEFFASDPRFFANALQDMSQNSFGQYFSDMLFELVYGAMAKGFRAKGISEKWIGLAASALVEDARLVIIIWLEEDAECDPAELLGFLKSASDAFASMICFERILSGGGSLCDHAVDVLSSSFDPSLDPLDLKVPKPHETSERRRSFEQIMARYR